MRTYGVSINENYIFVKQSKMKSIVRFVMKVVCNLKQKILFASFVMKVVYNIKPKKYNLQ